MLVLFALPVESLRGKQSASNPHHCEKRGNKERQLWRFTMALKTPLCDLLACEYPIMNAPMRDLGGPRLAAAVSNAGGFGVIQKQYDTPELFREHVKQTKALTERPFGASFLLSFPYEELLQVCFDEGVPYVSFYWGDIPPVIIERCHQHGVKVGQQVGTVADAVECKEAGVDIIIAQGEEAGGHVIGNVSTMVLVPAVVEAVKPVPVLAAGGIADARGVVAALALGAQGVVLGTRFLATPESDAHDLYKEKLLSASELDTHKSLLWGAAWPDAPHRVLRTGFVEAHSGTEEEGQKPAPPDAPTIGTRIVGGVKKEIKPFQGYTVDQTVEGEMDKLCYFAGQSVGMINELKPAGDIVRELVDGARRLIHGELLAFVP
ncbi:hypothetical protein KFL_006020020 [Klebsormidium nitens]|uniref:Uncharacterized protein n=1 Tax=Klebsormidium nitens TaxID=105231 RepID=A0A1Y1IHG1_KLENI|nr:hypothetical protein KFL_006020020 [Klebsormidium nitens]|eukprot:GAQ90113.1 hypothetical protein KFL_006020020 [Klebsormidium nitens]